MCAEQTPLYIIDSVGVNTPLPAAIQKPTCSQTLYQIFPWCGTLNRMFKYKITMSTKSTTEKLFQCAKGFSSLWLFISRELGEKNLNNHEYQDYINEKSNMYIMEKYIAVKRRKQSAI